MKKKITDEVLKEANQIAEQLGLDLNIPRIFGRQQHRSTAATIQQQIPRSSGEDP